MFTHSIMMVIMCLPGGIISPHTGTLEVTMDPESKLKKQQSYLQGLKKIFSY